jgi:hypothetical protein
MVALQHMEGTMLTTTDRAYNAGKAWRHARIKELTVVDLWAQVAWGRKMNDSAQRLLQSLPTGERGALEHLIRAYRLRELQETAVAEALASFESIAAGRTAHDPQVPCPSDLAGLPMLGSGQNHPGRHSVDSGT